MEASSERTIGCDGFKFIAIDTAGTVRRLLGSNLSDPNPHEFNEVAKSKDVVVDTDTGIFVRMYLPDQQNSMKLPIFFYAHGGGFCIGSASSTPCHEYLCKVAKEIGVLCVSVNYRLCPEHRLPAAYDDYFGALRWLLAGPGKNDPWIADHGDLGRVFLAGESVGGNLVHELGIRAGRAEWGADVCFQGRLKEVKNLPRGGHEQHAGHEERRVKNKSAIVNSSLISIPNLTLPTHYLIHSIEVVPILSTYLI